MEENNKISIVVPFYNGNKYIDRLITNVNSCASGTAISFELIVVNDSPGVNVKYTVAPIVNFKIIKNSVNMGIQNSRIKGLKHAHGKYVIFLDQDDELVPKNIKTQINGIQGSDICVGNGLIEYNGKTRLIFKTELAQRRAIKKSTILRYGTTIVSPGQCLIRRSAIPVLWQNTPLKINGADDEFLWLLMILKDKKFALNNDIVYVHKETENNLSYDFSKMAKSSLEYSELLRNRNLLSLHELKTFRRRRIFKIKRFNATNRFLIDLKYFDVSIYAFFIKFINI